ncbi:alanyl-tRNA editing protein [Alicyclobacillus contaminans]|uniref:alanyl-tRNA editing protein n=1 Tax=Alicyclobacillus contaminans TaxID=392016 RepID=UPI0004168FA8|nr:alanyl-tRNA editing protein [Alicyclobacillus contaminans]GMA49684.1 alanyl-tRNA editing protein [Alicyclobacillus contaminans]
MSIREERLYYSDSYLWEFSAKVEEVEQDGDRWHVRLNQTAFYPTSGGQPHDLGWLDEAEVVDVWIRDDHIYHTVLAPLVVGSEVHGRIDGRRRFDFMQQHCGQHILSRTIEELLGVDTVGFHLGPQWVTIDLAAPRLTDAEVAAVERRANEVVWENRPIRARFVDAAELPSFNLIKAPSVEKDIRIVSIEGFDDNACGGTHPAATGAVGLIKIVRTESVRGCVRVTFVCGGRALWDHQRKTQVVKEVGALLSCGLDELRPTVEKLQASTIHLQKQLDAARDALADAWAAAQMASVEQSADGSVQLVTAVDACDSPADLRRYALHLQELLNPRPHAIALVAETDNGWFVHLATHLSLPAKQWFQRALAPYSAKGGGSAIAAQGAVPARAGMTTDTLLQALRAELAAARV